MARETVLFVCTHNSSRSQMAEGLLRARYGERYAAYSAGTRPGGVNPLAVTAMAELGIDIAGHRSDHVDAFAGMPMDYVVTVCDSARESCPYLAARVQNIHHRFRDPSTERGSDEEKLGAFREIRDQIDAWLGEAFGPAKRDS